ncbi:sodium:proton exchanger [Sporosarcina sp. P12(2017)]|uniref:cation:proton antiporter n=1 Tax=unclassified Sporosarcina TaxID=2647733 RepID=UPI000C17094A|nr:MULTISPECIES: sodium:proton antiporter [unclassified Sporosarcina]PIC58388.1 sodium:proton exchanger [Sporosarcina sp. P10]PIC61447.1 sodium:proton exchanger [Sporosarcina sp. P12(2017)]
MEEAALISIVAILALGIFSQWLAWKIQWPSIFIMSIAGLLIGPIFGWVNPEVALDELYSPLISLAVAIILFEGSSNLDFREIKGISKSVFRVVTLGAFLAWVLGSITAHFIAGLTWEVSFIIGGLFVVTGPTVIIPLLRNAKLKARTAAVLKWEGIIVDPAGPLLALFAYEVIKVLTNEHLSMNYLLNFFGGAALAALLGLAMGLLISVMANKGQFPEYLKSPVILAFVLLCFTMAEIIMHETGMLAVTVMGLVLGRTKRYVSSIGNVGHFVENVSVMLTSTVFILLTASLGRETLSQIFTLPIIGFVLVMLFVVRPLSIWISTVGTELVWREKLLLGWIAPRGIVALTVAGYFAATLAEDGYEEATLLTALTFALVFITVTAHGFTLGPLAKKLNLASNEPPGVLIVGASSFSIALAIQLKEMKIPVLIVDPSQGRLRPAIEAGIDTFTGQMLSERSRFSIDLAPYDTILSMTGDASYNALITQSFAPEFGFNNTFSLTAVSNHTMSKSALPISLKAHLLFGEEATFPELNRKINTDYEIGLYEWEGTETDLAFKEVIPKTATALFVKKKNDTLVFATLQKKISLDAGDQLVVLKLKSGVPANV